MKALSVRQPWAYLLGNGEKTIELRSRPTKVRGKVLICSSKSGGEWWLSLNGEYRQLPRGTHMAIVEIVDCRPATKDDAEAAWCHPDDIVDGMWAWVIKPETLPVMPTPVLGKLNFFEVPDETIDDGGDALWLSFFEKGSPPKRAEILECY